jgi:Domain of unknown function (DUF4253)
MAPFDIVTVATEEALSRMDELLGAFPKSGVHPFLIGDDGDLKQLRGLCDPPADGGASILARATGLDVDAWLGSKGFKLPRQLSKGVDPQSGFVTLTDLATGHPKEKIHIGLISVDAPHHTFAKLGWGGWNDCPEPEVHVALHKRWTDKFAAVPVALSGDVVECFVARPPDQKPDVLRLAGEHYAYCGDIVDQGFESVAKLAASLNGAKVWYFWWD